MKRLLVCYLYLVASLPLGGLFCACQKDTHKLFNIQEKHAHIHISTPQEESKAYLPDEYKVTDLNLFIFNGNFLEVKRYISGNELLDIIKGNPLSIKLISGCTYRFLVCANLGYELPYSGLQELLNYRYYMAYPDEFGCGMIMSADKELRLEKDETIQLMLKRLMAKVSLRLDRSLLNPNIRLTCRSIKVCHCPRFGTPFSPSHIQDEEDYFIKGFELNSEQCAPLNRENENHRSDEVALYILENQQKDKNEKLGCYIEAAFDYESDSLFSVDQKRLLYRFYLEEEGAYRLSRGKNYPICLYPQGDGLGDGSWRVDRSHLTYKPEYCWYKVYPGHYIECSLGEEFTIRTECRPAHASCTFGEESLQSCIERGMIGYRLGEDGKSISIKALKKGSSLVDIFFGPPVSDTCFVFIVCEP